MKNLKVALRLWHYRISILLFLPFLLVILTGVLLELKKELPLLLPKTQKGISIGLTLSGKEILQIAQSVPEAKIHAWTDIDRIDLRPSKGIAKIRSTNDFEIQIDTHSGKILQVQERYSDLIESLHDGSFFHKDWGRYIFSLFAIGLLFLLVSGGILAWSRFKAKRRKKAKA